MHASFRYLEKVLKEPEDQRIIIKKINQDNTHSTIQPKLIS